MKTMLTSSALLLGLMLSVGCGQPASTTTEDKKTVAKAEPTKSDLTTIKEEPKHSGWWCDEHGVAEAECSMCSGKVAKECKAKGDWCDKHERAKSQCFICDPSLMEKAKIVYKAKTGKEMPVPTDNMPVKK